MKNRNLIIRLFSFFPVDGEGRCGCFSAVTIITVNKHRLCTPLGETHSAYFQNEKNERMWMFGKILIRNSKDLKYGNGQEN
jgi:hypothetical protein